MSTAKAPAAPSGRICEKQKFALYKNANLMTYLTSSKYV